MKKGIECYPDYDEHVNWCLKITKRKGRLSIDEIRDAAMEYEMDYYLMVLDCWHDPDEIQAYGEEPEGDSATLYPAEQMLNRINGEA